MELIEYIGYHGTDMDTAKKIIKKGFAINPKHNGWLGRGVYFFEGDKEITKEYSKNRHPKKIVKIIECQLEVPKDKIFDTTKEIGRSTFRTYREQLKQRIIKSGKTFKWSNSNHVDGVVYDTIVKEKGFELIRADTFTPLSDDRLNKIQDSKVPNGTELCLKKPICVKSKSIC